MLRKTAMHGERFRALEDVIRRLLGDDGCPWDRAQTPQSMRAFVIEEAFEVVEAIDTGDQNALREELGDLLMQVVFIGELARARGWFSTDDVIEGIREKLVRRHPHVFGDATGDGTTKDGGPKDKAEVLAQWEKIKREEKKGRGLLDGVPTAMPALLRALAVSEKAARVGFDWPDARGVRDKVTEELAELDAATTPEEKEHELGDLLFALASWARKSELDPEAALRAALRRFGERMKHVEAGAADEGLALEDMHAAELDRRWEQAKRGE